MKCDWAQFQVLLELHKFYFGILLTSTSFYLGIVGGLLAYVARTSVDNGVSRVSLAVPILLSSSAFVGYSVGSCKLGELHAWIVACKTTVGLEWGPHSEVLVHLAWLFAAVAALVTVGLIAIVIKPEWLQSGKPKLAT